MASCMMCGRRKVKKRKQDGLRWCRRCGCITSGYDRSGKMLPHVKIIVATLCA